jgi:H+/Cl- antiporter ClcA
MVSYLTGVLQTPITSFVIVSEMTQDHAMVIPLMVAALIADAISKSVCPEGLYHALARPFLRASCLQVESPEGGQDARDSKE